MIVHTPGPELLAVTPDTREDFLYDDIIDLQSARREHRRFVAILERFTRVHQVRDLLADVLHTPEARSLLIRETMDVVPSQPLAKELGERPTDDLVEMLICGKEEEPGPLARMLNEAGYALPPLPNLFFTRDISMVIGEHVMIGAMRYAARWSEELIMKALFLYHPKLANGGILFDGSAERRESYTLEGGDVHPLRKDLVLIGFSERSSPSAIDFLVTQLFERTAVTDVIVVVMPKENTAIHLDMIFTQVDRDIVVVYPPHFLGPERLSILHWAKGKEQVREVPSIFEALRACGMTVEPVFCGGERRTMQDREQWASGCNFVALRPGLALSYARSEYTLRELEKAGFALVAANDYLQGQAGIADGDRAVITFEGGELVRGGGGPRCMSCPVVRDEVDW
ncbi:MAG: arginine deiminase family protein [Gemmatimonadaceae bacterium]